LQLTLLLPEMPRADQLIVMTLPPLCCWINLAAALTNKTYLGVDAVTADTVPSTAGATPVLCHLLSQTTSNSPRTNKWAIHAAAVAAAAVIRDDDDRRAQCSVTAKWRADEWRASGDWWLVTGELVNSRQDINFWRTLTPGFKIRTYSYVHLWILDVFGVFWA